jgi:hypothetical protein
MMVSVLISEASGFVGYALTIQRFRPEWLAEHKFAARQGTEVAATT